MPSSLELPTSHPRVLFLDHVGVLGGAELSLLDIAEHYSATSKVLLFADGPFRHRLQARGVSVEVVEASQAVTKIKRGGVGIGHVFAIRAALRLARHVAAVARSFDAIFANSQKAFVIGALATAIAKKPLIWSLRDILSASHFSGINRRIVVFLARRFASRVVANSAATREAFNACGGRGVHVSVVHNGIDFSLFSQVKEAELTTLRSELKLDGRPIVGVFSRLAPWKGQQVFIEAMTELPGVQGLIVGDALFQGEDRYVAQLKAQVIERGLQDRVHFLGFRADIPSLMQLSDIIAHTSIAPEPFGRVIVEGMLAGKPVIATRAGGALEIIEDGVTGRLVEPNRPSEVASAIRALLDDRNAAAALAKRGHASARERFSVDVMINAMGREITETIAAHR